MFHRVAARVPESPQPCAHACVEEFSRMTWQTTRCSPDALPSTLDGGGMMLRACPAVCAAPHDAAPASHTAVRPWYTRRRCRCLAPGATNPGTGVLQQSFVDAVGAEMAAAAPPAAWLPQAPPSPQVTSPPTREGDWSQKHYSQVCHDPPGSRLLASLPCPVRGGRVRRLTRRLLGVCLQVVTPRDQGRRSERGSRIVYRDTPHAVTERLRVQRRAGCVVGWPRFGRWLSRITDCSFPPSRNPVRVLFVSESNLCRSILAGVCQRVRAAPRGCTRPVEPEKSAHTSHPSHTPQRPCSKTCCARPRCTTW